MTLSHLTMYFDNSQHRICFVGRITEGVAITLSNGTSFMGVSSAHCFKLGKVIDNKDIGMNGIAPDFQRRFVKAPDELPKYLRFFGYFAAKQEQVYMLALNVIVPITISFRVVPIGAIALDYFNQIIDCLAGMFLRTKCTQANHLAHEMFLKFSIDNSSDCLVIGLGIYSIAGDLNGKYFHLPIIPKVLFQKGRGGRLRGMEHHVNRGERQNKKFQKIFSGTFVSVDDVIIAMVTLPGIEPGLPG
jgi:hypothetical protein